MIKTESLLAEWISERRKKFSKDPAIMEAMIYALYLLEKLILTELEYQKHITNSSMNQILGPRIRRIR